MMALSLSILALCLLHGALAATNCGQAPIKPAVTFIVNGDEARPHSLPWMVSLEESFLNYNLGHACGASIIDKKWILTAAHCLRDGTSWSNQIVAGLHSVRNQDPKQRTYKVKKAYPHPQFKMEELTNYDIALLELETPIEYNDHVQPVCIPESSRRWSDGTTYIVSGWGSLDEGGRKGSPDKLQQLLVPHFNHDKCSRLWAYRGAIHEKVICAGYPEGGKDACQGDSGGPLVAYENGRFIQAGVVSWGVGCARRGMPGVYTDVAKYRSWMDNIMH